MKTIILKVDNVGLHYNENGFIGWRNTNLPTGDFHFSLHTEIYWEVEMVNYQAEEQILFINIINYNSLQKERYELQEPKRPIHKLVVNSLSEKAFKAQLSFYKTGSLNTLWQAEGFNKQASNRVILTGFDDSSSNRGQPEEGQAIKKTKIILQKKLSDTRFGLGVVKLEPFVKEVGILVPITIENDAIIPEFDHIKSYFAKALKSKYITIRAIIEVQDKKVINVQARSPELEEINDDLIQLVRSIAVEKTMEKPVVIAVDKSLFTGDELFDNFQEEKMGDVFERNDDELLKEILAIKSVRNVKQLQYLAGKLHETGVRLRFSLSPLFGFIFMVKGKKMNHFIWELLNSHATYLWSFNKKEGSLEKQFTEVEKILSFIREQGRQQYRQSYLNEGIIFQIVTHEQVNSTLVNSFPKWKNRLLDKLI